MRSFTVTASILITLAIAILTAAQVLVNQRTNAAIVTLHDRMLEQENRENARELLRQAELRAAEDAANKAVLEAASAAIFDQMVSQMVAASLK